MLSFLTKKNSAGRWSKVSDLRVGMQIAVPKDEVLNAHKNGSVNSREWIDRNDVLWDEIESIEYVGFEQVYDIEVEDTHNFVGNNIFAHNTYSYAALFNGGNVGIGTSTPNWNLQVSGANASIDVNDTGAPTNKKHWLVSNNSGVFNIGTSTDALSATSSAFSIDTGGTAMGIGTTSPWRTLSVTGTVGFDGLSAGAGAGSLCLSASNEVTYSAGATCTVSSARFKNTIQTSTTGLSFVMKLRPVTFDYNADIGIPGEQYGFIAEEVEKLDPRLVVHDAGGLPYSVRYENMTAVLAKAIQDLDFNMEAIASTTSATSTPESQSFATSFFQNIFAKIGAWLADATNGLTTVFANAFHAKQEICVDNQCLTANDVAALLQVVHGQQAGSNNGSSGSSGSGSSSGSNGGTASTTPPIDISSPVVTVTGTNPAEIPIGSTYSDFGATVTDTNADGTVNNNLGYKTILDGTEVQTITIDTTATSTHTIIYRATDGAGNVGEASRTVDVVTQ